ncbi:MAG: 4Fe-4S dicluster domain-containing protein, partial [Lachnospiraceae bacterium]|nr:4Fe-4S dicluster domain-containing protein [Lachnospiraceae bacterium]
FYMTDHGISVSGIYNYVIYYGVLIILVLPALIHGRRAACHYICWMAPFMVIGSTIGRWLHFPQLHIEAAQDQCISCGKCSRVCPMGLDVMEMVSEGMNSKCTECIQCGACVDECPERVLKYKIKWR